MADVVEDGTGNRDPVGVSAGLPAKAKLLASEVKGGRALYTGAIGAAEPCGAMEEELLRGAFKEERLDSAGLRELGKLPGNEVVEVYACPSLDKPAELCEGPLNPERVGLVGSVLTSAETAVADATCCSGLAGLVQCGRTTEDTQLTGMMDDGNVVKRDCVGSAGGVVLLLASD